MSVCTHSITPSFTFLPFSRRATSRTSSKVACGQPKMTMSTGFALSGPGAGAMLLMWRYISTMSSMVTVNRSGFFGMLPLKAASSVGDSGV